MRIFAIAFALVLATHANADDADTAKACAALEEARAETAQPIADDHPEPGAALMGQKVALAVHDEFVRNNFPECQSES